MKTSLIAGPLAQQVIDLVTSAQWDFSGAVRVGRWQASARHCMRNGKRSGGLWLEAWTAPYEHQSTWTRVAKRLHAGWTPERAKRHLADLIEQVRRDHFLNQCLERLYLDIEAANIPDLDAKVTTGEAAGHTADYSHMTDADLDYWRAVLFPK